MVLQPTAQEPAKKVPVKDECWETMPTDKLVEVRDGILQAMARTDPDAEPDNSP